MSRDRRVSLPTMLLLFWACWIGVLLAHFRLAYPAIVCRGHPPLAPNDLISLFVGPFQVALPAVFCNVSRRHLGVILVAAYLYVPLAIALHFIDRVLGDLLRLVVLAGFAKRVGLTQLKVEGVPLSSPKTEHMA
ncbi:hypothetical protein SH139x_004281 [Planctomycetaceae bacterium SH139]